jgi:hypothetical protein
LFHTGSLGSISKRAFVLNGEFMSIACFLFGHKKVDTFNVNRNSVEFIKTCTRCNSVERTELCPIYYCPDKVYVYCRFQGGTDELLYFSEVFKTLNQAKNKMRDDFQDFPNAANFGWKVIELMVCHET